MNLENKKQIAIIAIAICLGAVTAVMVGNYIQSTISQQTQTLSQEFQKQNKAAFELLQQQVGQELGNLRQQQQALAAQQDQLRKQVASGAFANAGTAVATTTQAPAATFSFNMPAGKREVTLNIDSLSAVGGLITKGDFIDIIAQLNVPQTAGAAEEVTSVLFQNLQVLAVGANFNPSTDPQIYNAQQQSRSLFITLAVDPEEAGLLMFAQTKGKLQLSLRAPKEKDTKTFQVASWQALADFVFDKQGTELLLPRQKAAIVESDDKKDKGTEVKPVIQIFKSGREY